MRVLAAIFLGLASLAWSAAAQASDTITYAPAPAWVKPFKVPEAKADASGPIQVLMIDSQAYLSERGLEEYTATAAKAMTAQGLRAMGTLTTAWDPARENLTIHRAEIRRGDQIINLLASPEKFQTLRRETNLSRAVLDGTLTGLLEVHGLRVGDVVVFETSTVFNDPLLQGHAETSRVLNHSGKAGQIRFRQLWPKARAVKWKASEFYGEARRAEIGELVEIEAQWTDVEAPLAPADAPARFAAPALVEISDYGSWEVVSRLMAPLYAKAATLPADSPLKAEAKRIRDQHATPEAQALAALQLVENDIRYLAITMGSGGYLPANADDTWNRRFGDCKAKTVLLIALLRELGIKAEASMVHSEGGNGLDERLPGMGQFDHVIVRAEIGKAIYWLDGTRSGDRTLVSDSGPPFEWALPIRAEGAALEKLALVSPKRPLNETINLIDASQGFDRKTPGRVQVLLRGDDGIAVEAALALEDAEDAEALLAEKFEDEIAWLDVKDVKHGWDETAQAYKIEFVGDGKLDWEKLGAGHAAVVDSRFTLEFPPRPKGPWADAPYSLGFPHYTAETTRVRLPKSGGGAFFDSGDLEFVQSKVRIARKARIEGDDAIIETSMQSLEREAPFVELFKAGRELEDTTLGADLRLVTGMGGPGSPQARAYALAQRAADVIGKPDLAINFTDEALRLDPTNLRALRVKLVALLAADRTEEALSVTRTLSKLEPDADNLAMEARLLLNLKRYRPALGRANDALRLDPRSASALSVKVIAEAGAEDARAMVASLESLYGLEDEDYSVDDALEAVAEHLGEKGSRQQQGFVRALSALSGNFMAEWAAGEIVAQTDPEIAVLHFNRALSLRPEAKPVRWARLDANYRAENYPAALTDADKLVADEPRSAGPLQGRAMVYEAMRDFKRASADYDAAVKASPNSADLLNSACWYRATNNLELERALEQCSEAVRLAPDFYGAWDSRGLVNLRLGRLKEAIGDYDRALEGDNTLAGSYYGRGLTKKKAGDSEGGEADIRKAVSLAPDVAEEFETYGLKK